MSLQEGQQPAKGVIDFTNDGSALGGVVEAPGWWHWLEPHVAASFRLLGYAIHIMRRVVAVTALVLVAVTLARGDLRVDTLAGTVGAVARFVKSLGS